MTLTTTQLTCSYIDICYPDYLDNHHDQDNELLLSTSVWDGMTTENLVDGLMEDFKSIAISVNHKIFNWSDNEIEDAIRFEVDPLVSTQFGLRLDLACDPEDYNEVYFYCYLTW